MHLEQARVLVVFPGSLGDFLCFLPALDVIREVTPGKAIELIVRGGAFELAYELPSVHHVLSLERGVFAQLFSPFVSIPEEWSRFFASVTEVFSWHGSTQPEVMSNLARFTQGPVRSFAFFRGQEDCHASAYYLRCVGAGELRCPSLTVREDKIEWLTHYWEHSMKRPSEQVLIIHPGSGGARKRWVPEGFTEVARWWQKRKFGRVLFLLGPAEEQEEQQWRQVGEVAANLSLWQVAALLSRADLYLGNDSGVSHLAGAVGARGVVLFGPTRPQQWRPLGGALSVLQNFPYRAAFPHTPEISLSEITVDQVIAALSYQAGRF